jgi:hypothetical protein
MDQIASELVVTERLLERSVPETLQRELTYRGELLATVYVEVNERDCTLAWPIDAGFDLPTLFDGYVQLADPTSLSAEYGDVRTAVEWWIRDEFFEMSVKGRKELQSAAFDLREREAEMDSPLDLVTLVQLVSPPPMWYDDVHVASVHLVFEVTFEGAKVPALATRLAVRVPSISASGGDIVIPSELIKLFSRFHKSQLVHTHPDIANIAFTASPGRGGFQMLRPIAADSH